MIPIRYTIPTRNYPIVNTALIAVNVVLFLVELSQGPGLERFIYIYGLVPARYTIPPIASYFTTGQQLVSLITFPFAEYIGTGHLSACNAQAGADRCIAQAGR